MIELRYEEISCHHGICMLHLKCGAFFYMMTHSNFVLQRPVPLAEVKVSPPKFDLAATNFPPLPGCVVSTQGEPVLENRMSDVVRGLNRDKVRKTSNY